MTAERVRHPEADADEIWIGNMFAVDFPKVGWETKRMGEVAYEARGRRIANFRPVFVKRAEIEAAGVPIPATGPMDHRW
jgi:hypothetical protein